MWTSDIIKAMQRVEAKNGFPICIDRIIDSPTEMVLFKDTNNTWWWYNPKTDDIFKG